MLHRVLQELHIALATFLVDVSSTITQVIRFHVAEDLLSLSIGAAGAWGFQARNDLIALVHINLLFEVHVL